MAIKRFPMLRAVVTVPATSALRQYGRDRTCVKCGAQLSRYNRSASYCFIHQRKRVIIPEHW